jgi:hypothetical protein
MKTNIVHHDFIFSIKMEPKGLLILGVGAFVIIVVVLLFRIGKPD